MSENQSPQNSSASQLTSHLGNMHGVSQLLSENNPQQAPLPFDSEPMDMWEAVSIAEEDAEKTTAEKTTAEKTTAEKATVEKATAEKASQEDVEETPKEVTSRTEEGPLPTEAVSRGSRETELLTLIHDLNTCNDALLARISGLQSELDSVQAALKAEAEKAITAEDRMHRQVSAEQASAQQLSQTAQQQIAKLVSQLEVAERSLSRQQLINENLQTEQNNAQERIFQLERESALIAQQYAEQAQALTKTEATNRDLRSRLQRQQRYTLQFKAALEKSLSVSARSANTQSSAASTQAAASLTAQSVRPVSYQDPATLAMPKAQRIMPWASGVAAKAFQDIDPHLETLIRNAGKPSQPVAPQHTEPTPTDSPEAEAQLWQDLERVMNTDAHTDANTDAQLPLEPTKSAHAITADSALDQAIEPETLEVPSAQPAENTLADIPAAKRVSSPVLNWQTQRMQQADPSTASFEVGSPAISAEKAAPEVQVDSQTKIQTEIQTNAPAEATADEPAKSIATSPTDSTNPESANPESADPKTEDLVEISQARPSILPSNSDLAASFAAAANRQSDPEVAFTEPSPWGNPLPKARPQAPSEQESVPAAASAVTNPDYLPALEPISTVSPLVNPLRTQKKKGSLASVQLPTFPNAKVGSFKR